MSEPGTPDFRPADATQPPAADLLKAMVAEMHDLYGAIDGPGGSTLSTDELVPPDGVYLVGWFGDEPIAGGALRRLSPDQAEIKRMYVHPDYRGRGIAALLLGALEDSARALGYTTCRLDTGPLQPHAHRLYERNGYVQIPDYNGNKHATYWAEKALSVAL